MTAIQTGGAELGRGVTARTIHVHRPDQPSDNDTFANIIAFNITRESRAKNALPWVVYTVPKRSGSATKTKSEFVVKKVVVASAGEKKRIAGIFSSASARKFVAKDFSTQDAFDEELGNMKIFRSVPSSTLEDATTMLVPDYNAREGILAVVFPEHSGWFMFSERCDVSVADMVFNSDADMDMFVRQTLENFAAIHRHGILHGDVKMGNMMYSADKGRFKLIDWGKSANEGEMIARYITNKRFLKVNNSSSPMAWMCAGLNYSASLVFMVYVVTRHMEKIAMCPAMRSLVSHAYASFGAAMHEHFGGSPLLHMDKVLSRSVRLQLLREHMYSFDLYDLALVFTSITCTFRGAFSERMCKRVAGLSKGLVGYDNNFLPTADAALEWWIAHSGKQSTKTRPVSAPAKSAPTTKKVTKTPKTQVTRTPKTANKNK